MNTEIINFDITENKIAELKAEYTALTINGIDDKDGYEQVDTARKVMKKYRNQVDARRKELTEDALKHQRMINAEAKRVTDKLTEIENYLISEQKKIDDALAAIKREEQRKLDEKRQHRIDCLVGIGFKYNGQIFTHPNSSELYLIHKITEMKDDEFITLWENSKNEFEEIEKKRLEIAVENERKHKEAEAEAARLNAIEEAKRKEEMRIMAEERAALEAKAAELREQERKVKEEAERLKREKQAEIDRANAIAKSKELDAHPIIENKPMSGIGVIINGTFKATVTYEDINKEEAIYKAKQTLYHLDNDSDLLLDFQDVIIEINEEAI